MKRDLPLKFLALASALFTCCAAPVVTEVPSETHRSGVSAASLTIDVTDLRDADGSLRILVFASADGFMKEDDKAKARGIVSASAEHKQLVFQLPPGRYAVCIFHDENDNGKLDTNFIGIPTEGYGVSNNPKPRFRAPRYREAVFELPAEGKTARISLQYVG